LAQQKFLLLLITCIYLTYKPILYCKHVETPQKFTLLTMLYNEQNNERRQEFITCMEHNLCHPSINHIHVFFDTNGNAANNKLLEYLKTKAISITYIKGRATFDDFYGLAQRQYPDSAIILSNADIYFDETLTLLEKYDLSNTFIALTRWDVNKDKAESLAYSSWNTAIQQFVPFSGKSYSQDTWIFKIPLPKFQDGSMQLGMLHFDPRIAYQAKLAGLDVINPCLSIKCHHLHMSKIRHYPWTRPQSPMLNLPFSHLDETDLVKLLHKLYTQKLRLPLHRLPFEELI
jgi:hypothetical protein